MRFSLVQPALPSIHAPAVPRRLVQFMATHTPPRMLLLPTLHSSFHFKASGLIAPLLAAPGIANRIIIPGMVMAPGHMMQPPAMHGFPLGAPNMHMRPPAFAQQQQPQ